MCVVVFGISVVSSVFLTGRAVKDSIPHGALEEKQNKRRTEGAYKLASQERVRPLVQCDSFYVLSATEYFSNRSKTTAIFMT